MENRFEMLAVGFALALCGCAESVPVPAGPSVILISIDTLRADHVGFGGYERETTPALDRLAEESIVFERAYTTMSWTLIAHMSLLTGLYPSQHGVVDPDHALPDSVPTLAQRLRERGYRTLGFYRPGWLDPRYGFDRGFDVYEHHHGAPEAEEHVFEALDSRPEGRPFFLFVQLFDVHNAPLRRTTATLYEPPAPYDSMFLADARERLGGIDGQQLWHRYGRDVTPEQREAIIALYDGGVRYVDATLGRWLERWGADGTLDDTLLVITSDHGEGLGQRPRAPYKGHGELHEEGLRIPLLVRLPGGVRGGTRVREPVSIVDVLPTVLETLGLGADERLAGRSLVAEARADRIVYAGDAEESAVIRWPWKVVGERGAAQGRAFDLESDPGELRSIRTVEGLAGFRRVADPIRAAAEAEQASWFRPSEPNPLAPPARPESIADLRALQYAGPGDEDAGDAE